MKRKNGFEKCVIGIIIFVFTLIVLMWILFGAMAVKTYNYVNQNGVKGFVERVWDGENK
jgi:hypothetical protein